MFFIVSMGPLRLSEITMIFGRRRCNGSVDRRVLVRVCETCPAVPVPQMIDRPTREPYYPNRERSPAPGLRTPERKARLLYRSHQGSAMERQSELRLERQWELYRRSVAEGMPDSDYKAAVLAGIAHALMRLDAMEASRRHMRAV